MSWTDERAVRLRGLWADVVREDRDMHDNIHFCASTDEAYNSCNNDESFRRNDVIVVAREGVVGVAWAWPIAVTIARGEFHSAGTDFDFENAPEREAYRRAVGIARDSGLDVNPIFEHLLAMAEDKP